MKNTELDNQKLVLPKYGDGDIVVKNIKYTDLNTGVSPDVEMIVDLDALFSQYMNITDVFVQNVTSFVDSAASNDLAVYIYDNTNTADISTGIALQSGPALIPNSFTADRTSTLTGQKNIYVATVPVIKLRFTHTDLTTLTAGEYNIFFKIANLV